MDKDKMTRDSFIFYRSFQEAIEECPKEEQLEIYKAITAFALDGVKPNLTSPFGKVCWRLIEPVLLANWKRYVNGCKGKEHGSKGGNPSFAKGKRNPYYPKDNPKDNPKITPKITPNEDKDVDVEIIDSSLHSESSSSNDDIHVQHAGGNAAFEDWLKNNCPYIFAHYKLPTDAELTKLKTAYGSEAIADTCCQIENRKGLRKNYTNLYRTLLNWLKRREAENTPKSRAQGAAELIASLANEEARETRNAAAARTISSFLSDD